MKVRVVYMVQDPLVGMGKLARSDLPPVDYKVLSNEAFYLDGPVTPRVAVVDFDEKSGALLHGAKFESKVQGEDYAEYKITHAADLGKQDFDYTARDFMQVSVFATVANTISMFEEADTLGRNLSWAFDGNQLLLVPRAGHKANAFYERESRSLQFFFFDPESQDDVRERIYTALSQDVIAHETAHAVLDGIAPDLYDALTPQSSALHEAIADLTALVMAFRSNMLASALLSETDGKIRGEHAFSFIAEQFGFERDRTGRMTYLRSLWNEKNLDPDDTTKDDFGHPNSVSRASPHLLSQVLTGALYRVACLLHDEYAGQPVPDKPEFENWPHDGAFLLARPHFQRLIFRALDYLPPGEVSFADYGRAIHAADQASHPNISMGREKLRSEFHKRRIVDDPNDLVTKTDYPHPVLENIDLDTLVESDWVAYSFADQHRELLHIPDDVTFTVRKRLDVTKTYDTNDGETLTRECIFKVSWDKEEPNEGISNVPPIRRITVGTTLVVDWQTRHVRALLPSDAALDKDSKSALAQDRNERLAQWAESGRLHIDNSRTDVSLAPVGSVRAVSSSDAMRVVGTGRLLHVDAEDVDGGTATSAASASDDSAMAGDSANLAPPPGVDAGAFFNLISRRHRRVSFPTELPPGPDGALGIRKKIAPISKPAQIPGSRFQIAMVEVSKLVRAGKARRDFHVDGSGLTVAVIDTGLNAGHVDFAGRVIKQWNCTSDNNSDPNDAADGLGHGTNVTGIIAANGKHLGIAPGVNILPMKSLQNMPGQESFANVERALNWILSNRGQYNISAVCVSLGSEENLVSDAGETQHSMSQYIAALETVDVPVVAAAGNLFHDFGSKQGMAYPAILNSCISVGAVYDEHDDGPFVYPDEATADKSVPDQVTPFTQRLHPSTNANCYTDIFAPGAQVVCSGIGGTNTSSLQDGTSQAAPVVAGIILLMQQYHLREVGRMPTVDELKTWIRQSAKKITDSENADDNVTNTKLEFKRIDAYGALDAIRKHYENP